MTRPTQNQTGGDSLTISKPAPDEAKKLSVVPRGHWRNKWFISHPEPFWFDVGRGLPDDMLRAGPSEWFGTGRWPSKEVAEQKALEDIAALKSTDIAKGDRYLGPVFFPEDENPPP